jgi:cytochrome c-type biogenesis protein CcmH/NrfG
LIGGALVVRPHPHSLPANTPRRRALALTLVLGIGTFASVCLVGNSALSASESARKSRQWDSAAAQAQRARMWLPWSPAPWEALGRVQRDAGFASAARLSFMRAVSIDPGNWELWAELAAVSQGRARTRALHRAATLYPLSGLLPSANGNANVPQA